MSILIACLYVIEVLVCLMLALVVMLQKPKEGGLGGAIGGGMLESSLGADAGNVLIRTTAVLGAIFLINTLVLARLTSTVHSKSMMAHEEAAPVAAEAPALPTTAPELPAAPVAPAAPAAKASAAPVAPAAPAAPAPKAPAAPANAK